MTIDQESATNGALRSPREVMLDLAGRVRRLRLEANITQQALAARVGVATGTIKRFEKAGLIQLHHLLRVALVLGCLEEFDALMRPADKPLSLFQPDGNPVRKRARGK